MEDRSTELRPSAGHYVFTCAVVVSLWLLLGGTARWEEVVVALIVGVIVTALMSPRLSVVAGLRLSLWAPVALFRFATVFCVELIRANFDMARRVLSPSLPINPAVVEVRTRLRSPLGKLLLANSITLTPGTLSIDVRDDRILVHWIDRPPGIDIDGATRAIAETFERHIGGFLK